MGRAYFFDTELTDRKEGEIIEAAWLKIPAVGESDPERDRIPRPLTHAESYFCARFRPEKPSTFGAMAIHHILPDELKDCAPSSTFKLPDDVTYLIGHSIDTDRTAAGVMETTKGICTHAMAQHLWPDASGFSQSALLYMLIGPFPSTRERLKGAHNALEDVRLNATLLKFILELKPEIETWSALWEYSEECRIPLYCPLKRWEGQKLNEMDSNSIGWCLRQDWLDPYFRKGLVRVMEARHGENWRFYTW